MKVTGKDHFPGRDESTGEHNPSTKEVNLQ
jgi:hypothetical protein